MKIKPKIAKLLRHWADKLCPEPGNPMFAMDFSIGDSFFTKTVIETSPACLSVERKITRRVAEDPILLEMMKKVIALELGDELRIKKCISFKITPLSFIRDSSNTPLENLKRYLLVGELRVLKISSIENSFY
ncbi:MAG: hypothetical protein HDR74_06835 [Bacteroides sp.]|nr:hypothetical protein [Bacteroides sp.]